MTRPEVAALHRALREQLGDRMIDFDNGNVALAKCYINLAPLVDAVLAAQWQPIAELKPVHMTEVLLWAPLRAFPSWCSYLGGGWADVFTFLDLGPEGGTPTDHLRRLEAAGVTHFRVRIPPPKDPPA